MQSNIRYLIYFSFLNCFRPHWPIAILYFHMITGSFALAMMIHSIAFFTQAVSEVPAGSFSDRYGRRGTMIAGSICASLSIFLYAIGFSFWVLVAGGVLEGLGRALFSGTDSALLYESVAPGEREEKFKHFLGRVGSMYQLALCLSAILCALVSMYSLQIVLWIAVIPQLASIVMTLQLVEIRTEGEGGSSASFLTSLRESVANFRANRRLKLLAVADTIDFGFGESLFYFQSAFFGAFVPMWVIGVARCLNHLTGFVGFWFAAPVIRLLGAKSTLIAGTSGKLLVKLAAISFPSIATPFLMAGANIIYGPCSTARGDLLQSEFSEQQRATMGSLVSLSGSLLFAIVSLLLGVVADTFTTSFAMVCGLVGASCTVFLYRMIWPGNTGVNSLKS